MKILKQCDLSKEIKNNAMLMLYFSNDSQKCRLADIMINETEKVLDEKIAFFKADLSSGNLAECFNVKLYPTFIIIKKGRIAGLLNDLPDSKIFIEFIKKHTH